MNCECLNARSAENWFADADAETIAGGIKERKAKADRRRRKPRVNDASLTEIEEDDAMDTRDLPCDHRLSAS
jgi:hypothetical protein